MCNSRSYANYDWHFTKACKYVPHINNLKYIYEARKSTYIWHILYANKNIWHHQKGPWNSDNHYILWSNPFKRILGFKLKINKCVQSRTHVESDFLKAWYCVALCCGTLSREPPWGLMPTFCCKFFSESILKHVLNCMVLICKKMMLFMWTLTTFCWQDVLNFVIFAWLVEVWTYHITQIEMGWC